MGVARCMYVSMDMYRSWSAELLDAWTCTGHGALSRSMHRLTCDRESSCDHLQSPAVACGHLRSPAVAVSSRAQSQTPRHTFFLRCSRNGAQATRAQSHELGKVSMQHGMQQSSEVSPTSRSLDYIRPTPHSLETSHSEALRLFSTVISV